MPVDVDPAALWYQLSTYCIVGPMFEAVVAPLRLSASRVDVMKRAFLRLGTSMWLIGWPTIIEFSTRWSLIAAMAEANPRWRDAERDRLRRGR